MSGLRDLVGGAACSGGSGGASSNPVSSFADALLGGASKSQSGQLRELPGGLSEHTHAHAREFEASAFAQEGALFHPPGAAGVAFGPPSDFLRSFQGGAAGAPFSAPARDAAPPQHLLAGCLHSFVASGRSGAPLSPVPIPQLGLSPVEKQRIRDRSGILARHMFAEGGERFAERQVGALLASLHIADEAARPGDWPQRGAGGAGGQWAEDYAGRGGAAGGGAWVEEFRAAPSALAHRPPPPLHEEWAHSFAAHPPPGAPPAWGVAEFAEERQAGAAASGARPAAAALHGAHAEQTRALVETLSASAEPKFQQSKFLQFVSKMSRGELVFEGNAVRERSAPEAWAQDFAQQRAPAATGAAAWADEFGAARQQATAARGDWAADFASVPQRWADEFQASRGGESGSEPAWSDAYESFLAEQGVVGGGADLQAAWGEALAARGDYQLSPDNPYTAHPDPLAEGLRLFRQGVLSEAALALEAACARDPGGCEAWRLLGTVHAENDDDRRAIAAMARALAAGPGDGEVLLALGVSHTNELDAETAVAYVAQWLRQHPRHGAHALQAPPGAPLETVLAALRRAAAACPGDADLHTVQGVLCNLSRDYDAAVDAFSAALQLRPQDYSLWNKLGATQANSARSEQAIAAYQRALELKPNYVRAWCNMGIGYANQGAYAQSAGYYVRALSLNPQADSVWGYLRISLACIGREDLVPALDAHQLEPLLQAFPL